MRSTLLLVIFVSTALISFGLGTRLLKAQDLVISSTPKPVVSPSPEGTVLPTSDITQPTQETLGPLEKILEEQKLGPIWPKNPIKYAIRAAIESGVPANTIVLLLLLPVVAAIIAAARHLIGLRGFGIFLPAALSVTFVATGPIVGIGLFLIIILVSILIRFILRKVKIKLQYLPRMALLLLFVVFAVLGVLFAAPIIRRPELTNVSIFAVLILVLLAEDFTRVQLGKSAKVAINLTTETLILSLVSYMFLTLEPLQRFALLNPEILILSVAVFDFLLGKYAGLRFLEFWRFRKLING
ncbi:MAG TPA: 7TM domain-containing protein [Patescibacteria group bacterium]|nr:7TM domain-containing protein [Patescibacteria group bacterium]